MHADIQACKHVNTRACMHVSMYACEHVCMHEHVHACRARTTQRIKAMQSMACTILINKKNFQKNGWRKPPFACACETHDHATTWTFRLTERSCNACENDKTVCKTSTKQYYFMRMPPDMSYHAMAWNYHAARLDSHVVQHIYDRCNNLQFMLISWLR